MQLPDKLKEKNVFSFGDGNIETSEVSVSMPVCINGCALGLRGKKNELLYKPWTLMTNSPFIFDVFRNSKCPSKDALEVHMKVHLDCMICGKTFDKMYKLNRHMKSHT